MQSSNVPRLALEVGTEILHFIPCITRDFSRGFDRLGRACHQPEFRL